MNAEISQIAVTHEGNKAYAVYFIHVTAENVAGEMLASWNILRRYSDFHELHLLIERTFPHLTGLCFPGKKTFNNLDRNFLEKRRQALNIYLKILLSPDIIRQNPSLEQVVATFLMKGNYDKGRQMIGKKLDSFSFINPILSGVKSVGNAVVTMPDSFVDGVFKMGDGLGRMTKSMFGISGAPNQTLAPPALSTSSNNGHPPPKSASSQSLAAFASATGSSTSGGLLNAPSSSVGFAGGGGPLPAGGEGRVGAPILLDEAGGENIPLRILLLLMDEVFNLRTRNTWFRRRLVNFLQGFVRATFGSSINRKIVDFVAWLTNETQVAEYLRAFRDYFWPNGRLAEPRTDQRSQSIQMRTRVIAKAKMIAALPDELRLFIGNETTRSGTLMVFETFQNPHLNRRFCYVLLERLLRTIFPENRFDRIFTKLHSKSPRCQAKRVE
jgi:sorting nexin-13